MHDTDHRTQADTGIDVDRQADSHNRQADFHAYPDLSFSARL